MTQPDGFLLKFLKKNRWGTKQRELQQQFADAGLTEHPEGNAFVLPAQFLDTPAHRYFYFQKGLIGGKLIRMIVIFFPNGAPDQEVQRLFTRIKTDVSSDLGPPDREVQGSPDEPGEFRMTKMVVWQEDESILTVTMALEDDRQNPNLPRLAVGYGHKEKDPISRNFAD